MMSILIPSKQEPRILEMLMAIHEEFPSSQVVVANDRYGHGKGWALREALSQADGEIICFIDGDMDIHPRMIWRLLPFIDDYDIVVGRKQVRGLLSRRILTRFSRLYIRALFQIGVDTQTGIKLFRKTALKSWETNGFMYDLEVLAKARKDGKSIIEIPVEAETSKPMKPRSILKCLIESFKIRMML